MSIDLPNSGFQDLPEIAERTARTSVDGFLRFGGPAVRVLLPASLIIGCTVAWALTEGTNAALAVLVGYSALASTIALVQSIPATKTRGYEPKTKQRHRAIMRRRTLRPEIAKVVCSAAREIRSSRT